MAQRFSHQGNRMPYPGSQGRGSYNPSFNSVNVQNTRMNLQSNRNMNNTGAQNTSRNFQNNRSMNDSDSQNAAMSFPNNRNMNNAGAQNTRMNFPNNRNMNNVGAQNTSTSFSNNRNMNDSGAQSTSMNFQNNRNMSNAGGQNTSINFANIRSMNSAGAQNMGINFSNNRSMNSAGSQNMRINFPNNRSINNAGAQNARMNFPNNRSMNNATVQNTRMNFQNNHNIRQSNPRLNFNPRSNNPQTNYQNRNSPVVNQNANLFPSNQRINDASVSYQGNSRNSNMASYHRGLETNEHSAANEFSANNSRNNNMSSYERDLKTNDHTCSTTNEFSAALSRNSMSSYQRGQERNQHYETNEFLAGNSQDQQNQQVSFTPPQSTVFSPLGIQTSVPFTSVAQQPIVQHVMIPIPVPVGTEIPAHLFTPQIISTPAAVFHDSSQNAFNQSQQNFHRYQPRGQLTSPSQFSDLQSQGPYSESQRSGDYSSTQNREQYAQDNVGAYSDTQNRVQNAQDKVGAYSDKQNRLQCAQDKVVAYSDKQNRVQYAEDEGLESHFGPPGDLLENSGQHELNYYIGKGSSSGQRMSSERYDHRDELEAESRQREENWSHEKHFEDREYENQDERADLEKLKYQSSHQNYSRRHYFDDRRYSSCEIPHEYDHERHGRSRDNSGEQDVLEHDRNRERSYHSSDSGRNERERYTAILRDDRSHSYGADEIFDTPEAVRSGRDYYIDERSERSGRSSSHEHRDLEREQFRDRQTIDDLALSDERSRSIEENIYRQNYHDKEHRVDRRDELNEKRMTIKEGAGGGNSFDDTGSLRYSEHEREFERNDSFLDHGRDVYVDKDVGHDIEMEDNEGYDRKFESDDLSPQNLDYGKRKMSPVSAEELRLKSRREHSPASRMSSHGEMKIHISDTGRWIETNDDVSPVSDKSLESKESLHVPLEREMIDDRVYVAADKTIQGTEQISDTESLSENEGLQNLQVHASNVSPEPLKSSPDHNKGNLDERLSREDRVSPLGSDHGNKHNSKDRRSPTVSLMSHQSENSHQSRKSFDKSRLGSVISDTSKKTADENIRFSKLDDCPFKVSELCNAHNRKGCHKDTCFYLHICKHFIIGDCKFGDFCTKSHEFMSGQPFWLLNKLNPGFIKSRVRPDDIKALLKNQLCHFAVPSDVTDRLNSYRPEILYRHGSPVSDEEEIVAVDPSFDARNYAPDAIDKLIKSSETETLKSKKTEGKDSAKSKEKSTENKNEKKSLMKEKTKKPTAKSKKVKNSSKGKGEGKKSDKNLSGSKKNSDIVRKDDGSLSPVSGDEENWEQYEKYEQVSDDDSEIEDKFDDVSSEEADEERSMSPVNTALGSFPEPTPQNIAVPIGMNDPLVFNRPLKNNPQSYVGPLNRPPPSFPIAPAAVPIFPVVSSGTSSSVIPVPAPGIQGIVPPSTNHLPSPEFMKHVIQSLPKYPVHSGNEQNSFKNDNNPKKPEVDCPKRKNMLEKVEKDPELKETIKPLWTFPHKNVINMSIIEFVTETEAYREEFIAEIIRILVTLELPYVTLKKLISLIKDKVSINVKSETDLRKILEMYPSSFRIIEMVESDDEDNDDDTKTKKNVQIKANINIGFCERHGFLPFALGKCDCSSLHLCRFYFLGDCTSKHCKFGHKLTTEHNVAVLKQHKLHRLTGEEIMNYLADVDNRSKDTIPGVCKYYIREKGCYKGDSTDSETICHSLHLCFYILKGKCMNRECERSHSIRAKQPLSLLQKYGLDPNELGDEKVLQLLGEKVYETEKEKEKKVSATKQSVQGKPGSESIKSSTGSSMTKKDGHETESKKTDRQLTISFANLKIPAICKFYQKEMGCRKKDWGPSGKCFFLHICQYYVTGECKFGDKCKRSHDLFSGQAAEILRQYNFDLDVLTAAEILQMLNISAGAPVEIPKVRDNSADGSGKRLETSQSVIEQTGVTVEKALTKVSEVQASVDSVKAAVRTSTPSSVTSGNKGLDFKSGNIEDLIKHIMEHKKVNPGQEGK